jgi:hypothetical protein
MIIIIAYYLKGLGSDPVCQYKDNYSPEDGIRASFWNVMCIISG